MNIIYDDKTQKYFDHLNPNNNIWIPKSKINKYLLNTYNLTQEQYFNIVVHNDINYKSYCEECSKELRLKSLTKGYFRFCNQSCITTNRLKKENLEGRNPFQQKDFIEKNKIIVKNRQLEKINNNKELYHLFKKETKEKAIVNKYKSNNFKISYLYTADTNDKRIKKIGITSKENFYSRNNYQGYNLTNHQKLLKGNSDKILEIERNIVENFCIHNYEIFPSNRLLDVKEFIKNKVSIESSTTIEILFQ
jgi:hypothetical protein